MTAMSRPGQNDVIIVSDGGRSAIRAFDITGAALWTYRGGAGNTLSDFPDSSPNTTRRKLSSGGGEPHSWPGGSGECRSYPPETADPSFKPAGLSVDHQGRVMLADCSSGRVSVVSSSGQLEHCILGEKDGVRTPRSLSVDNHGLLVVVDLSSFKLYQLETKSTCFST